MIVITNSNTMLKYLVPSWALITTLLVVSASVVTTQETSPQMLCFTSSEAVNFCNRLEPTSFPESDLEEDFDFDDLPDNWKTADNETNATSDWRLDSLSAVEKNRYLLQNELFTDCSFVVGPENNTQVIKAHRIFLLRANPVFEYLFGEDGLQNQGRKIRIADANPTAFKALLNYVYTDEICMKDFDMACQLVGLSSRMGLPKLGVHARGFLWANMYPGNMWKAFRCAKNNNDKILMESTLQMMQRRTEDALTDPTFADISQDALVSFLKQGDMNITSELRLYEASLRWAMKEAQRKGLPPSPESMRTVLGPALKHIRFLLMTPSEFANMEYTSKILTYSESLAVIFNLNSPGVMPLPDTLCSISTRRNSPNISSTFTVLASPPSECEVNSSSNDSFNVFSTTIVPNKHDRSYPIYGIQLPMRKKEASDEECAPKIEQFTVQVINGDNDMIYSTTQTKNVSVCENDPSGTSTNQKISPRSKWQLVNVKFNEIVTLPRYGVSSNKNNKFKIIYHDSATYPSSLGSGEFTYVSIDRQYINGRYEQAFDGVSSGTAWLFGKDQFVYSMIIKNS